MSSLDLISSWQVRKDHRKLMVELDTHTKLLLNLESGQTGGPPEAEVDEVVVASTGVVSSVRAWQYSSLVSRE